MELYMLCVTVCDKIKILRDLFQMQGRNNEMVLKKSGKIMLFSSGTYSQHCVDSTILNNMTKMNLQKVATNEISTATYCNT